MTRLVLVICGVFLLGCDTDSECTDGHKQCTDGKLQTCTDGTWGEAVACPEDQMCHAMGGGADHCMPGDMMCTDGETKCIDGKLSTCANEMWGEGEACEGDQVCVTVDGKADVCGDETEPAGCTDGTTQCIDGKLSTCAEGQWGEGEACPEGEMCHQDDGKAGMCMKM